MNTSFIMSTAIKILWFCCIKRSMEQNRVQTLNVELYDVSGMQKNQIKHLDNWEIIYESFNL